MAKVVGPAVGHKVPQHVASGRCCSGTEVPGRVNVDVAVDDSIHHGQLGLLSSVLEGLPPKISYHLGGAARCAVISLDEACCPSLDRLQLLFAYLGV